MAETPLGAAAAAGNAADVARLLAAGAAVDEPDEWGMRPLYRAALHGHIDVVEQLLAVGASAELPSVGELPLHAAAWKGHVPVLRRLLAAAPQSAMAQGINGATALFDAARTDQVEAAEVLLAAAPQAASIPASFDDGEESDVLPIHHAAKYSSAAMVRLLLQAAPETAGAADSYDRCPLHYAAEGVQPAAEAAAVTALLLEAAPATALARAYSPEWDQIHWTPLHLAAAEGNVAAVRPLVVAAPAAALMEGGGNPARPFGWAVEGVFAAREQYFEPLPEERQASASDYMEAARMLLDVTPAREALPELWANRAMQRMWELYPDLVARWPLTAKLWQWVPADYPGLGRALPAVLRRSTAEAAALVAHLPAQDRQRLRTFALALHRRQRVCACRCPRTCCATFCPCLMPDLVHGPLGLVLVAASCLLLSCSPHLCTLAAPIPKCLPTSPYTHAWECLTPAPG